MQSQMKLSRPFDRAFHFVRNNTIFTGLTQTQKITTVPQFFLHVLFHLSVSLFSCLSWLHHICTTYFPCPLSSPWATSLAITGVVSEGAALMPSRPQLRASAAGPMWRRGAYKLYPPGEHSLCTMLLFTEFLQRRHTDPPWEWAWGLRANTHTHTHTHTHTTLKITHTHICLPISLTLTAKEINARQH